MTDANGHDDSSASHCFVNKWVTDLELHDYAFEQAKELSNRKGFREKALEIIIRRLERDRDAYLSQALSMVRDMQISILRNHAENFEELESPFNTLDGNAYIFITPHVKFKGGETFDRLVRHGFPIAYFLSIETPYIHIVSLWLSYNIYQVFCAIVNSFEKISDPEEQEIIKAMYSAGARYVVFNYDNLISLDIENAIQRIAVTSEQISQEIEGHQYEEQRIERILWNLQERGIVKKEKEGWRPVF
jgi:hypothetical protein